MNQKVYALFEKILKKENIKKGKKVLEIGAMPSENTILNSKELTNCYKVGINLEGGGKYKDFDILKGDANDMSMFKNNSFDCVLCNATFEHDKYFWKSLDEIRRVIKKNGLIIIGVPGYKNIKIKNWIKRMPFGNKLFKRFLHSKTFRIHNWPGDYYRFSEQAVKEVLLDNCEKKEVVTILNPPRIIGKGRYVGKK